MDLGVRMKSMEKTLKELKKLFHTSPPTAIKEEANVGVKDALTVARISARDPYAYALQAMDILFTKEELASSLLFSSKKSTKPELDKKRVETMLTHIDRRFGKDWDIKILTSKANQKCRDSKITPPGSQAELN